MSRALWVAFCWIWDRHADVPASREHDICTRCKRLIVVTR